MGGAGLQACAKSSEQLRALAPAVYSTQSNDLVTAFFQN